MANPRRFAGSDNTLHFSERDARNHANELAAKYNLIIGITILHIGQHVQLHPATDRWMMGDKYGTIDHFGDKWVHVLMDRSGKLIKVAPRNILPYDG